MARKKEKALPKTFGLLVPSFIVVVVLALLSLVVFHGQTGDSNLPAQPAASNRPEAVEQSTSSVASSTASVSRAKGISAKRVMRKPVGYRVVATHAHDPARFTQGLLCFKGKMFESTGMYHRSELIQWDVDSGAVIERKKLSGQLFGEGLTLVRGHTFVQLTWRERVAIFYDANTLEETARHKYDTDGWGLVYSEDMDVLIMTDSSSTLTFRDPDTFAVLKRTQVKDFASRSLTGMNELEMVDGELWANIYGSFGGHDSRSWNTRIARIDPETSRFLGWIEMQDLVSHDLFYGRGGEVLNGIAWDRHKRRLFLTGKLWPKVFEVVIPALFPSPVSGCGPNLVENAGFEEHGEAWKLGSPVSSSSVSAAEATSLLPIEEAVGRLRSKALRLGGDTAVFQTVEVNQAAGSVDVGISAWAKVISSETEEMSFEVTVHSVISSDGQELDVSKVCTQPRAFNWALRVWQYRYGVIRTDLKIATVVLALTGKDVLYDDIRLVEKGS